MGSVRLDPKRDVLAAASHERAAQHYRQASKHYGEDNYAGAVHESQVARW